MRRRYVVLAVVVCLGMTSLAAAAGLWNFNANFSAAANPNGAWSYGMIEENLTEPNQVVVLPYSMTLFTASLAMEETPANWWTMPDASYSVPCVYHNYTLAGGIYTLPQGMTALHPGPIPGGTTKDINYVAVARWTAPADGATITIEGTFFAGNTGATSNLVILNGGSETGSILINDHNTTTDTPISLELSGITAGDTIDFIVGMANNFPNNTTPLEVIIADNPTCQDIGIYMDTDFNQDCYVNLEDFAVLAQNWLKCTDPQNPVCE